MKVEQLTDTQKLHAVASESNGYTFDGLIRRARTADVLAMQKIVNQFADEGAMLHRSLSELYENIRDFHVVEEAGAVVGCSALHVNWKDLAELR